MAKVRYESDLTLCWLHRVMLLSLPGTQNLTRLAQLKGWSFDELQFYLEGEPLPPRLSVPQLLAEVRSLPFEAAAEVARVALDTMASKREAKAC